MSWCVAARMKCCVATLPSRTSRSIVFPAYIAVELASCGRADNVARDASSVAHRGPQGEGRLPPTGLARRIRRHDAAFDRHRTSSERPRQRRLRGPSGRGRAGVRESTGRCRCLRRRQCDELVERRLGDADDDRGRAVRGERERRDAVERPVDPSGHERADGSVSERNHRRQRPSCCRCRASRGVPGVEDRATSRRGKEQARTSGASRENEREQRDPVGDVDRADDVPSARSGSRRQRASPTPAGRAELAMIGSTGRARSRRHPQGRAARRRSRGCRSRCSTRPGHQAVRPGRS